MNPSMLTEMLTYQSDCRLFAAPLVLFGQSSERPKWRLMIQALYHLLEIQFKRSLIDLKGINLHGVR